MFTGFKLTTSLVALTVALAISSPYGNVPVKATGDAKEVFTENTSVVSDSDNPEEVFTVVEGTEVVPEEYILDPGAGYEKYVVNAPDAARDAEWTRNANLQQTFTLKKGGSKTFSFTVNGGVFSPNHNSVSVVIDTTSSNQYYYIFENVTENRIIHSATMSGHFSGTCSNMDPNDTYEVTIINLGNTSMTLTTSITTYIS